MDQEEALVLEKLLTNLSPILRDGEYVFGTWPRARYGDLANLDPLASCREPEGLTLVIPKRKADEHQYSYDAVFRVITLQVNSSLEAVGLTAVVSKALAESGIPANMIAGFFHDHILIPSAAATSALRILQRLTTAPRN